MTTAKNKKHFEESWNSQINTINQLWHSIPKEYNKELIQITDRLKELIKIASNHTYGDN